MMSSGGGGAGGGGMQRTTSYELLHSPMSAKYGSGTPLSHLTDSVNCLDPLNAMEKSLADQVCCQTTLRVAAHLWLPISTWPLH